MYLTANGQPVAEAVISYPRSGRIVGTVKLGVTASTIKRGDAVTLKWQTNVEFKTTCTDGGSDGAFWRLKLVGGKGKLHNIVPVQYYQGIQAATIAKDLLREVGEEAGDIDLPEVLPRWVRQQRSAWVELQTLLQKFEDRVYRILLDGRVWIGKETWSKYGFAPTVLKADPSLNRYVLPIAPSLVPGMTLEGVLAGTKIAELGKVGRVIHRVSHNLRTEAWLEP